MSRFMVSFVIVCFLGLGLPQNSAAQVVPIQGGNVISVSLVMDGGLLPASGSASSQRVTGVPGREYAIRVTNLTGSWIEVLASVDGLDVIDQGLADPVGKRGYVLGPWATYDISGWRTSLDRVDAFRFVPAGASEAAARGVRGRIGQIQVAAYLGDLTESGPVRPLYLDRATGDGEAPAEAGIGADMQKSAAGSVRCERCPGPRPWNLGTGRGGSQTDQVTQTSFRRYQSYPDQQVFINYGRGPVYREPRGWLE